ncbi:hypothetical protein Tco_0793052 [Tanacetum coccineum]
MVYIRLFMSPESIKKTKRTLGASVKPHAPFGASIKPNTPFVVVLLKPRWRRSDGDKGGKDGGCGGDTKVVVVGDGIGCGDGSGGDEMIVAAMRWEDGDEGDSGGWRPENGQRLARIWLEKGEASENI